MSHTLTPIPFWCDDITIGEVISATPELFYSEGRTLAQVTNGERASLYDMDGDRFLLELSNRRFIEFHERK